MEWFIKRLEVPKEVVYFLENTFLINEVRGQVGYKNGIKFIIHSNEQNHSIPHVHAEYGEHSISISLKTFEVLSGNLPKKQTKFAVNWVKENREKLMTEWKDLSISATSSFTASMIDNKDGDNDESI